MIDFWYEWHFPEAEQQLQKAIAIQPNNADAHRFYAVLLTITGRGPESIAELEKAKELSPLSLIVNALESQAYLYDGNIDKAIEQANKTLEIEPNFWIAHLMLARAFIQQGRFDEAALEGEKAAKFSAGNSEAVSLEINALAKGGRRGEALSKLDDLKKRAAASYVPSYNLAMISLGLGQTDEALDHLETAIKDRDACAILLKVEPKWNAIRDLPRFDALFHQVYPER